MTLVEKILNKIWKSPIQRYAFVMILSAIADFWISLYSYSIAHGWIATQAGVGRLPFIIKAPAHTPASQAVVGSSHRLFVIALRPDTGFYSRARPIRRTDHHPAAGLFGRVADTEKSASKLPNASADQPSAGSLIALLALISPARLL